MCEEREARRSERECWLGAVFGVPQGNHYRPGVKSADLGAGGGGTGRRGGHGWRVWFIRVFGPNMEPESYDAEAVCEEQNKYRPSRFSNKLSVPRLVVCTGESYLPQTLIHELLVKTNWASSVCV